MDQFDQFTNWLFSFEAERGRFIITVASLLNILGVIAVLIWRPFKWLRKPKPAKVEIANPEALSAAAPAEPLVQLTLDQYTERLEMRAREVRAELEGAHHEDRARLQAQLDALGQQLAAPDQALAQAQATIRELEHRLAVEADHIRPDRLAEARAALDAGDFSQADAIFAELERHEQAAVEAAARAAFARGEIAEAETRWGDAARAYGRAAGLAPSLPTLLKAHEFAWRNGDYAATLGFSDRALRLARAEGEAPALIAALKAEALSQQFANQPDKAEPLLREAIALNTMEMPDNKEEYAKLINNLAMLLHLRGQYEEAGELYRQALSIERANLGPDHPNTATRMNNLAELRTAQGRLDEAEPLYRKALEIRGQSFGPDHPNTATLMNNLGEMLRRAGRMAEAEPLLRRALEIWQGTLGRQHPYFATGQSNLARLLVDNGRAPEAKELAHEAHETRQIMLGPTHPETKEAQDQLEQIRAALGQADPLKAVQ